MLAFSDIADDGTSELKVEERQELGISRKNNNNNEFGNGTKEGN